MTRPVDGRPSNPLLVLAGLVAVASIAMTAAQGVDVSVLAVSAAFAVFIAIGEVLRITLPGGRQAAPIASAGALAFAFMVNFGDRPMLYGAAFAVTVVTIGSVAGALPQTFFWRGLHLDELARRVLTTGVAAVVFRSWLAPNLGAEPDPATLALLMTLVATCVVAMDVALAAAVRSAQSRSPFRTALVDEFRASIGLSSAVAATGVLIALTAQTMSYWALPVFVVPLLLTQFSYRRYATIDDTYKQTMRSLSKVTEVGGYTGTGHSSRVSRLTVTIGRELGISERGLTDLEYAALMHDIGQLSLPEPIASGATTLVAPDVQKRIARFGAEVIRQAGVLDLIADIVERQADSYRNTQGVVDASLPIGSRIIKAVNAYDDLVGASLESDRMLQAIERLRIGADREYDPEVIDIMAGIIDRQISRTYV
ncbi:MAG: HD domain-containing phosphohydrolase [Actinomycetes bacterium]|jgi:acid phosphatase family membrane protein YuiD